MNLYTGIRTDRLVMTMTGQSASLTVSCVTLVKSIKINFTLCLLSHNEILAYDVPQIIFLE